MNNSENVLSHEKTPISNEIVGSTGINEFSCPICAMDTVNETWEEHMNNPTHLATLEQFNLIFENRGEKVYCKVCNINVNRETLRSHGKSHLIVPWDKLPDEYDKYEIFFENFIFQWKNIFSCSLCEVIFSEWWIALVHIADKTHQSLKEKTARSTVGFSKNITSALTYELLVSEGFVASTFSTIECRICSCNTVAISSIIRHTKGLMHLRNRLKFAMKIEEENSMVQTVTREINENLVIDNVDAIEAPTSGNDPKIEKTSDDILRNAPCNYIVKQNFSDVFCIICDCKFSVNDTTNHLANKDHSIALERYGCENILPKDGGKYDCNICNCEISCLENVYSHIKGKRHSHTMHLFEQRKISEYAVETIIEKDDIFEKSCNDLPNFGIVKINENDSCCFVCSCIISTKEINMNIHLTGKYHENSRKKHGCENIFLRGDNVYYCKCCNCQITGVENVYAHIKETSHMNCLTEKPIHSKTFPESPAENPRQLTISTKTNSNFLNSYIVKINNNEYHCKICNRTIGASTMNINQHIAGKLHTNSLRKYGCQSISHIMENVFYCSYCHLAITGFENFSLHIKNQKHLQLLLSEERIQELNKEEIAEVRDDIRDAYVVKINEENFWCFICECKIFPLVGKIDDHLMEQCHREALIKYGCDKITLQDDNTYYCRYCSLKIDNLETVRLHINKSSHANFLIGSNELKNHKDSDPPERIGMVKSGYYIVKINDTWVRCEVCDCILPQSFHNVRAHVVGKYHVNALKKYGCENILYMTGNYYHCKCCNLDIPDVNHVHQHIKTTSHMDEANRQRPQTSNKRLLEIALTKQSDNVSKTKTSLIDHWKVSCPSSIENVENHNATVNATMLLRKHECGIIKVEGEDIYYCTCCNCNIAGSDNLCLHTRGKKHLLLQFRHQSIDECDKEEMQ